MNWCWSWSSNVLATWCKELSHWKRPWCLERLRAREEGWSSRWDGWMTSLTQWTWAWAEGNSERQGRMACCISWSWKELDVTYRLNNKNRWFPNEAAILELQNFRHCKVSKIFTFVGKESACQYRRHKRCRLYPWVRKIPWNRKWQLTSVFLPGKFLGQRSMEGYSPWSHKEFYTTEQMGMHWNLTYFGTWAVHVLHQ